MASVVAALRAVAVTVTLSLRAVAVTVTLPGLFVFGNLQTRVQSWGIFLLPIVRPCYPHEVTWFPDLFPLTACPLGHHCTELLASNPKPLVPAIYWMSLRVETGFFQTSGPALLTGSSSVIPHLHERLYWFMKENPILFLP